MRLIFLGPPGAGKGTHAKILSEKTGAVHLAAGDILRRHIREQTLLGKKAKSVIEKGELVSDLLVNQMMGEEIKQIQGSGKTGFILDGYPRTINQAEFLDKVLKRQKTPLDAALNFVTTEDVIVDRLSGRRVCAKCGKNYHVRNIPPKREGICDQCGVELMLRKDDQPDTIKNRLKIYRKETEPLIGYYAKKRILWEVSGDFDVPELQAQIQGLFENLKLLI